MLLTHPDTQHVYSRTVTIFVRYGIIQQSSSVNTATPVQFVHDLNPRTRYARGGGLRSKRHCSPRLQYLVMLVQRFDIQELLENKVENLVRIYGEDDDNNCHLLVLNNTELRGAFGTETRRKRLSFA